MKYIRYEYNGDCELGLLNADDLITPLKSLGFDYRSWRQVWQDQIQLPTAEIILDHAHIALTQVQLLAPLPDPSKIICVGLNYKGHADEQQVPYPQTPMLFSKASTAITDCRGAILLPCGNLKADYEVELAVVIGRRGKKIAIDQAMDYVAGFMVVNDVSARRWQKQDKQFFRAKSSDSFFPCGPYIKSVSSIANYRSLRATTHVNDKLVQDALVSDLIHDIPELISFISASITLLPGDIISTGTPAGVGCYRDPPQFLQAGDQVTCAITELGAVRNVVHQEE